MAVRTPIRPATISEELKAITSAEVIALLIVHIYPLNPPFIHLIQ